MHTRTHNYCGQAILMSVLISISMHVQSDNYMHTARNHNHKHSLLSSCGLPVVRYHSSSPTPGDFAIIEDKSIINVLVYVIITK